MVLALQNVCATVCAPDLSLGQVVMLDNNIEEYSRLRIHAFPKIPLKKNITKILSTKHQEMESLHTNNFLALAESSESSLYEPGNHRNEINSLVEGSFEEHINNTLKVSKKVNFHGVNYSQNMSICIGKSVWGNFLLCRIELILINHEKTNIFFIGRTSGIISNLEFGVCESVDFDKASNGILQIFLHSSPLAPHPLPEIVLTSSSAVYLPKYSPFDPDM